VADALDAPLDVCVARKLGVPGHRELAFGAIASGGATVLNPDVIRSLNVSREAIERVLDDERHELERRERLFRENAAFPIIVGETVILVDDGAATGASISAAVLALRRLGPGAIVVAVPVASRNAVRVLRSTADDCVCLTQPEPFYSVGAWYENFEQTTDDEVRDLLRQARRRWDARPARPRTSVKS
jgi:putative phosphoribosyl transferase